MGNRSTDINQNNNAVEMQLLNNVQQPFYGGFGEERDVEQMLPGLRRVNAAARAGKCLRNIFLVALAANLLTFIVGLGIAFSGGYGKVNHKLEKVGVDMMSISLHIAPFVIILNIIMCIVDYCRRRS